MTTVTVQIGNSDDKLTQKEWSNFAGDVADQIVACASQVHFNGTSNPRSPYQNAAWVFEIEASKADDLKDELAVIRTQYQQDSVAWTEGETSFI